MLIQIIRNDYQHDYIMDFMLDSMIDSENIVKFKRSTGWVTIGTDTIRTNKYCGDFNGTDRRAVHDSTFVHRYLRSNP